jgi:hypothetical protein
MALKGSTDVIQNVKAMYSEVMKKNYMKIAD